MHENLVLNFLSPADKGVNLSDVLAGIALIVSFVVGFFAWWESKLSNAISMLDNRAEVCFNFNKFMIDFEVGTDMGFGVFHIFECKFEVLEQRKFMEKFKKNNYKAKYIFDKATYQRIENFYTLIGKYLNNFDVVRSELSLNYVEGSTDSMTYINKEKIKQSQLWFDIQILGKEIEGLLDEETRVLRKIDLKNFDNIQD